MADEPLTDAQIADLIQHYERETPASDVAVALRELQAAREEIARLKAQLHPVCDCEWEQLVREAYDMEAGE